MNDFSLLGIGACGGNQVAAFKKYGVNSFYINSAIQDLNSLNIQDMHYYHIKDALGCHKNRDVSKEYLSKNYEDILQNIERYLNTKYIFLFGSTGGGTSSGMIALMTELLESELDKIVIPVVTIPSFSESLQAKTNCYNTLKELIESATHTVFMIDNNKESNFTKSNTILADTLYSLLTDVSTSTDGIYDYSEIYSMLETKGYGIVSTYNRKPTQIDITNELSKAISNNIFVDIESRNPLYYCGIKSSTMKKTININTEELQLKYGYWRDCFVGYQTKSDLVFLSGLQYPTTLVNNLYEAIESDKEKIQKDLQSINKTPLFKDCNENWDAFEQPIQPKKKLSVRERLLYMRDKG